MACDVDRLIRAYSFTDLTVLTDQPPVPACSLLTAPLLTTETCVN